MSAWANLKIGVRITIGFSLVIALLGAGIVVATLGLTSSKSGFANYATVAGNASNAIQLDRQIVGLRRNFATFLAKGDQPSLQRLTDLRKNVAAQINDLQQRVRNPQRQKMLADAEQAMQTSNADMDKAIQLRNELETLRNEQLTPNATAATKAMEEVTATAKASSDIDFKAAGADARANLMAMRFDLAKVIDRGDLSFADKLPGDFDGIQTSLAALSGLTLTPDLHTKVRDTGERIGKYIAAAKPSVENQQQLQPLVGKIDDALADVSKQLGELVKSQQANLDETTVENDVTISHSIQLALLISAIAVAAGIGVSLAVTRSITKPVGAMTESMGVLAQGDTSAEIPAQGRKDEIGRMASAVQVFKDNMIRNREMQAREAAEQETRTRRAKAIESLTEAFDRQATAVVKSVASAATEMQATASSMSSTAEETSRQATTVAAASEQASANVQTVASAAEELASSVAEISRQVAESTRIAGDAVSQANRSGGLVKALSDAAQKIGAVVNLINEIASQTNLLALNATIEAARAGEAGKGFAVVASEVKSLANQTAKATEEIGSQIGSIQQVTGETVEAIGDISGIIGRISDITTAIAAAVEEQGAATQEIARNVQEAATGTQSVSANIGHVTEAAQHTGAAATQLLGASGELSKQAEELSTEVVRFIAGIKAA